NARWHQYEPVNRDNARAGAKMAFGRYADPIYRFADADVVVSLDSDFLMWSAGKLRYAREFARRRKTSPEENANRMNRLYVFEASLTITGAKADQRFRVRASEVPAVARSLAETLTAGAAANANDGLPYSQLAEDLLQHQGRCIVLAGDGQP